MRREAKRLIEGEALDALTAYCKRLSGDISAVEDAKRAVGVATAVIHDMRDARTVNFQTIRSLAWTAYTDDNASPDCTELAGRILDLVNSEG